MRLWTAPGPDLFRVYAYLASPAFPTQPASCGSRFKLRAKIRHQTASDQLRAVLVTGRRISEEIMESAGVHYSSRPFTMPLSARPTLLHHRGKDGRWQVWALADRGPGVMFFLSCKRAGAGQAPEAGSRPRTPPWRRHHAARPFPRPVRPPRCPWVATGGAGLDRGTGSRWFICGQRSSVTGPEIDCSSRPCRSPGATKDGPGSGVKSGSGSLWITRRCPQIRAARWRWRAAAEHSAGAGAQG
jgi:hypothetical protein